MTRRNLVLVFAAGLVVIAAWFFLLWKPKGAELDAAHDREVAAEARASQLQVRLAELRDAERRRPELVADGERLAAAVPAEAQLADFLLAADRAADEAGVDFVSVSPSPVVASTTGGPAEVPLSIEVGGGYFRVLDYLDRLLALPRLVVLDTVSVTGNEGGAELGLSITGRMFTTAAPAGASTPADGLAAVPATATTAPAPPTETMEAG